jgi:hypothetical protein
MVMCVRPDQVELKVAQREDAGMAGADRRSTPDNAC